MTKPAPAPSDRHDGRVSVPEDAVQVQRAGVHRHRREVARGRLRAGDGWDLARENVLALLTQSYFASFLLQLNATVLSPPGVRGLMPLVFLRLLRPPPPPSSASNTFRYHSVSPLDAVMVLNMTVNSCVKYKCAIDAAYMPPNWDCYYSQNI